MKKKKVIIGLVLMLAGIYFTCYNVYHNQQWYNFANIITGMLGVAAGGLTIINSEQ